MTRTDDDEDRRAGLTYQPDQRRQMVEDYLAWKKNPQSTSVSDIIQRHGISRQAFYDILDEAGVERLTRKPRTSKLEAIPGQASLSGEELGAAMAMRALEAMLDRLTSLELEVRALRVENLELRTSLSETE